MRLFLSSENLGNYPEVFLRLIGKKKLALVENAKDDWTDKDRKNKVQEHIDQFSGQGFDVEEIDLRNYFNQPSELSKKLNEFGGIFVFGGNTFLLRRAMAASGFDKAIKKLLKEDKVAYGGSSAGSCVAAPSLRGLEHGDSPQPDVVPKNYPSKKINWEGLGLVPFYTVPHYKSDWWGKEADQLVEYLKNRQLDYYALRDGQVVLLDGDREEFLK